MLVKVHSHRPTLCTRKAASDIAKLKNYQRPLLASTLQFSKSAKRSRGQEKVYVVLEVMFSKRKSTVYLGFPSVMLFMLFVIHWNRQF